MATAQPAPGYVPPASTGGNGLAIAGMVLGILGLATCWVPFVGAALGLVGVILSALGWSRAGKVGGKNKGMAIAGFVCGILGVAISVIFTIMAMVAVSGFTTYMKKSKMSESQLQLRKLERSLKQAYVMNAQFPVGKVGPTPSESCCGTPRNKCEPDPTAWADPTWQKLDFQMDEQHYFRYSYESDGETFTVKAIGDLDCDGTDSELEMRGRTIAGNVQIEIGEPTPD